MRKLSIFLIVMGVLSANTQEERNGKRFELYAGFGTSIPTTAFYLFAGSAPYQGTYYPFWYSSVLHVSVGFGHSAVTNPPISATVQFDWNKFNFNKDKTELELEHISTDSLMLGSGSSIISVTGNIRVSAPSRIAIPYLKGGLGAQILSVDTGYIVLNGNNIPISVRNPEALCVNFGAGIDFPIGNMGAIFMDGTYQIGFTEPRSKSIFYLQLGVAIYL